MYIAVMESMLRNITVLIRSQASGEQNLVLSIISLKKQTECKMMESWILGRAVSPRGPMLGPSQGSYVVGFGLQSYRVQSQGRLIWGWQTTPSLKHVEGQSEMSAGSLDNLKESNKEWLKLTCVCGVIYSNLGNSQAFLAGLVEVWLFFCCYESARYIWR